MRRGSVYRLCSQDRCRAKVPPGARTCPRCGGESLAWAFKVDSAVPGATRRQRQRSGFKTKADATEALNRLQAGVVDGTHVERSRRTLGVFLLDWLAAKANLRPNTRRDYSTGIVNHINPRLGDVPLQAVDRLQVRALYRELAASGLSEKTVHGVHIPLRKALQDAVEDGLIRKNPADRAHATPRDRPEMLTWNAGELADFLSFTANDPDHAIYQLAAASGMRRGELLGLRWRDVDLDNGRVSVKQQWTRQGSALGFGPPKSAKSVRTIDVDPDTVEVLRIQQDGQRFRRKAWGKGYATVDLVFARADGSPHDPNEIGRRFVRRVRELATVPVIALHGLRHTHATLLLEDGVDVKTVSERLGHDSIQTTLELYGHVTPRMRTNAAVRFGSLMDRTRERSLENVTRL